ncbi:hypothetical protein OIV83_004549 [Microbotryomycetes sp. JL201]|nr:hypothetical protein OIV83_004549 [Microbotryomycetes sp. JL201]
MAELSRTSSATSSSRTLTKSTADDRVDIGADLPKPEPARGFQAPSLDEDELNEEAERKFAGFGGDLPPELGLQHKFMRLWRTPAEKAQAIRRQHQVTSWITKEESTTDANKVQWESNDPENPQNWSHARKWPLTVFCASLTVNVTFASSAPSQGVKDIAQEFGVGLVPANLVTSMFLLGFVCGPMVWAPLSEMFGRRSLFMVAFFGFALFQIPCALAPNFGGLIVCRFIAGLFGASPLTNAGGVVADMWDAVGRGPAMSLFSASVFMGPVLGPIVGGFVSESFLGWRWTFWLVGIWGLTTWTLICLFLPETYHPKLLANKAQRLRKQDPEKNSQLYADLERANFTPKTVFTRTLLRPWIMLASEPTLLLVTIYLAIVYSLLYATLSAFPIIWEDMRGSTQGRGGLIFIGVGIGTSLGALINVNLQRHYRTLVPKWHGHPPPEERLYGAMCAGPILVTGLMWLGWTGNYPSIHWAVPAGAAIIIGMSFTLVFISLLSYVIEVYLMYSASALAANPIVRSALAASFPLFMHAMYKKLGVNWATTLIAMIALLIAPSPFIFYRYGARIRGASRFAPCLDIVMRERVEREALEQHEQKQAAQTVEKRSWLAHNRV